MKFKWGWLMRAILDWHAITIVLFELCERTEGVDEAWTLVDRCLVKWYQTPNRATSRLWKPMYRLYQKAHNFRRLHRERAHLIIPDTASIGSSNEAEMPAFGQKAESDTSPSGNSEVVDPYADTSPLDFNSLDHLKQPFDEYALLQDYLLPEDIDFAWTTWDNWPNQDKDPSDPFHSQSCGQT